MRLPWPLAAAALAWLLAAGCADLGDDPVAPADSDPPDPPDPPAPVSFSEQIQPILDNNCVSCHGTVANAGLDLRPGQSYANLVGVQATESTLLRVQPGAPLESWLYLKLTGAQNAGTEMPPGNQLSADVTDLVRDWIEEGALDN